MNGLRPTRKDAVDRIRSVFGLITEATKLGASVAMAEILLSQARTAVKNDDFAAAMRLCDRAEMDLRQILAQFRIAHPGAPEGAIRGAVGREGAKRAVRRETATEAVQSTLAAQPAGGPAPVVDEMPWEDGTGIGPGDALPLTRAEPPPAGVDEASPPPPGQGAQVASAPGPTSLGRPGLPQPPITKPIASSQADLPMEWRTSYISKEDKPANAFKFFSDMIRLGVPGIVVSREHPDKLPIRTDETTKVFWLSKTSGEATLSPSNLAKVAHVINTFTNQYPHSVALLDGFEYLVTNNDFSKVTRFLDDLHENTVLHDAILIVPISPTAFSTKELTLLERNMTDLGRVSSASLADLVRQAGIAPRAVGGAEPGAAAPEVGTDVTPGPDPGAGSDLPLTFSVANEDPFRLGLWSILRVTVQNRGVRQLQLRPRIDGPVHVQGLPLSVVLSPGGESRLVLGICPLQAGKGHFDLTMVGDGASVSHRVEMDVQRDSEGTLTEVMERVAKDLLGGVCPRCGADLASGETCPKCGWKPGAGRPA